MSTAKCLAPAAAAAQMRCLFPGREHRTTVTVEEFKAWLRQFDTDGDGRISRRELREAIRRRGAWFATVKAWCAVRRADRDRSGFVDEWEMENLIDFAEKELGFPMSKEPPPGGGRVNSSAWPNRKR